MTTAAPSATRPALGFVFAFTAVSAYGCAQVLTRHGASGDASPIVGSFIALVVGTLGFSLLAARQMREPSLDVRRGALLFAVAGFFSTLGVVAQFLALHHGEVVLVSPISNTNPLFTLLVAAVMLRGMERLTPRVWLGAGLVVAGVAVLRLG